MSSRTEEEEAAMIKGLEKLNPKPENLRSVAMAYADQVSLLRRTTNAIAAIMMQLNASKGSTLFKVDKDPLAEIPGRENIISLQVRIMDMLLLIALGQDVDIEEFQEYAQILVQLYGELDMPNRFKKSSLKDQTLRELEQEWLDGNDMVRVQQFFRGATLSISNAAEYCGITISPLPEF